MKLVGKTPPKRKRDEWASDASNDGSNEEEDSDSESTGKGKERKGKEQKCKSARRSENEPRHGEGAMNEHELCSLCVRCVVCFRCVCRVVVEWGCTAPLFGEPSVRSWLHRFGKTAV